MRGQSCPVYIFSDRISAVFVRLVFSTELSWNQILMKLGEAITLRYEEQHFKKKKKLFWPFRVQCMFRQLETCSKQKRAGLSHILFSGYVWLAKNVYNRTIQTSSSLCLCIIIIFYLNLYLSEITPVELVLWHKLS